MAISTIQTRLDDNTVVPPTLLHYWREVMGQDIWKFNQVDGADVPENECSVWIQSEREELARELSRSFRQLSTYLHYFPMPVWTREDVRIGLSEPFETQALRTQWGYVQAFGQRATSLIEAGATITYSKSDTNLAQNDTATISVTTTVTDASEIQVFFRTADGAPAAADSRYQILPLTVTISGGTATITGHRALFVLPTIWNKPFTDYSMKARNNADTATAGHFVTTVDVYRVYNDTTTTVQILSDPILNQQIDLDTMLTQDAVALLVDSRQGEFNIRIEATQPVQKTIYPKIARVYYKAGLPLLNREMDYELAEAMVKLTNANLPEQPPPGHCAQQEYKFQDDTRVSAASEAIIQNPFGTLRGHQNAWRIVRDRLIGRGGKLLKRTRW